MHHARAPTMIGMLLRTGGRFSEPNPQTLQETHPPPTCSRHPGPPEALYFTHMVVWKDLVRGLSRTSPPRPPSSALLHSSA